MIYKCSDALMHVQTCAHVPWNIPTGHSRRFLPLGVQVARTVVEKVQVVCSLVRKQVEHLRVAPDACAGLVKFDYRTVCATVHTAHPGAVLNDESQHLLQPVDNPVGDICAAQVISSLQRQ